MTIEGDKNYELLNKISGQIIKLEGLTGEEYKTDISQRSAIVICYWKYINGYTECETFLGGTNLQELDTNLNCMIDVCEAARIKAINETNTKSQ